MESLLLLLSPFVVSIITSGVKRLRASKVLTRNKRKVVLRFVVAFLSFAAVVGGSILSGNAVDPVAIETFAETLMVLLSSTGLYFFAKKK